MPRKGKQLLRVTQQMYLPLGSQKYSGHVTTSDGHKTNMSFETSKSPESLKPSETAGATAWRLCLREYSQGALTQSLQCYGKAWMDSLWGAGDGLPSRLGGPPTTQSLFLPS